MKKTVLICLCLALTACASESTEVLSETSETAETMISETGTVGSETSALTVSSAETTGTTETTVTESETESTDKQAMSSLFNDTKIIADWNYGTMYGLNKERGQDVITWRYNGSGGAEFGIFDISGYDDVCLGIVEADISKEGEAALIACRQRETADWYFLSFAVTESGSELVRYRISDDPAGFEKEVLSSSDGDAESHREECKALLRDYTCFRYLYKIGQDKNISLRYNDLYFEFEISDIWKYTESIRVNGISIGMSEDEVIAALGQPNEISDIWDGEDGIQKSWIYENGTIDLWLDEHCGIWRVDEYYFDSFTSSIGIETGSVREDLLDSELKLRPYWGDYLDDETLTVENADMVAIGSWKWGGLGFFIEDDVITGVTANNGTSI